VTIWLFKRGAAIDAIVAATMMWDKTNSGSVLYNDAICDARNGPGSTFEIVEVWLRSEKTRSVARWPSSKSWDKNGLFPNADLFIMRMPIEFPRGNYIQLWFLNC
jgi:hypothetical protein